MAAASPQTPPTADTSASDLAAALKGLPSPPRIVLTGLFMGLANIVPGVSGGTMVLALGLYEHFIDSVAEVTRPAAWLPLLTGRFWGDLLGLRLRRAAAALPLRAIVFLALLAGTAAGTIVLLSTIVHHLMETRRPEMYGLFIGLTLGGVPLLWREVKPLAASSIAGIVVGFALMVAIALFLEPGQGTPSFLAFLVGGFLGSAAMVLPGISGSYLLLVMGLYTPIIFGISEFKDALKAVDLAAAMDEGLRVILPVGVGMVLGIGGLSNLLKALLNRYQRSTLGFLLGLLLGSVVGLYPFQPPSFPKLARYAVAVEGSATSELRLMPYGWQLGDGSSLDAAFVKLATERRRVAAVGGDAAASPTIDDVAAAKEASALVVCYRVEVSREARRAAEAADVELIVVPDTTPTPVRWGAAVGLLLLGFGVTLLLGRLESAKS